MVDDGNLGNRAFLSEERNEDGLYPIHGIAIGNNDITVGHTSGEPKLWRPEVLEQAADTLEGRDIVVNHENQDAYKKIGEVEESKYDEEKGVVYRGAIDDDELAEKIARDWLEVSPRIRHSKEHEELEGVKVPEYIQQFDNLSVVRRGAAKSNEVELGETEELSVEQLQESFEGQEDEETSVTEYQNVADEDVVEEMQDDINYARWMYKDQNGAIGASSKFSCEGSHKHEVNGEEWYMPCNSHDEFLKGLKQVKQDEMSYSEGDFVKFEDGVGEIIECSDSGVYDGSIDEDRRVRASEDDPAALIQLYESEEEELEETDKFIGRKFSEIEIEEAADYTESSEMKRVASQLSSLTSMTKTDCLRLLHSMSPEGRDDPQPIVDLLTKSYDVSENEAKRALQVLGLEEAEDTDKARISSLAKFVSDSDGFDEVDEDDVVDVFDELRETDSKEEEAVRDSVLNRII